MQESNEIPAAKLVFSGSGIKTSQLRRLLDVCKQASKQAYSIKTT